MGSVSGRRGVIAPAEVASRTVTKARKKVGRPARLDDSAAGNLRERILDASERIFASLGYAGTTLREISQAAGVTQALINYYFGSKFGLFGEVFLRRAEQVSDERMEGLHVLKQQGRLDDVDALVRAFLQPTIKLRAIPQGRAFLHLHARLHTEPPQISYQLRKQAYEESTMLYTNAIHKALPGLSKLDVHWRMTMMVGTYLYAFSDTHRMEDFAHDVYDPEDSEELMRQVVSFIVGGVKAGICK